MSTPPPLPPTAPAIRRGTQWLTSDDLRAHLAALLRVENVGTLLGAGASMGPLGGLTMAALWNDFTTRYANSHAWLTAQGFIGSSTPNPETLAGALEITLIEWERVNALGLPLLRTARADLARSVARAALLQPTWWQHPGAVDMTVPELESHRALLKKLSAARQPGQPAPWIFTTNYDLAIEWAAESIGLKVVNGFDGVHRRTFSPHNFDLGLRNVLARGEARFGTYNIYLAKLHGSLTWTEDLHGISEHASGARWSEIDNFLQSKTNSLPALLVQPNAAKYLQTLGFVLGELVRRFTEFLSRPQTVLIVSGFSFSDEHLNRLLLSALQNPTLQLVIYLPEFGRSGDNVEISTCSPWAQKAIRLGSPQVTVVGGGAMAYFTQMVEHLPDPAIYDDAAIAMAERVRKLLSTGGP